MHLWNYGNDPILLTYHTAAQDWWLLVAQDKKYHMVANIYQFANIVHARSQHPPSQPTIAAQFTMYVKQCDCLKHYLCMLYGDMIRTILAATIDSLDDLRKLSKISFFVVTHAHAQSCWTVVDSTKSVSAELSDFRQWRQFNVESEIKSPWTLKNNILNDIKNTLY
jgi:hypothetical protein